MLLNLRPSHPELRDPAVWLALLQAIDRLIVADAFEARAVVADLADPADVVGVRLDRVGARRHGCRGRRGRVDQGGLDEGRRALAPAGATEAYTLEIL